MRSVMQTALLLSAVLMMGTAQAVEYWAVSSYKEPFEGVDALRSEGVTVRELVVDLHRQYVDHTNLNANIATRGGSLEERKAYAEALIEHLDQEVASKALKSDLALRLMLKKLGVREVPVLIRYERGNVQAVYGPGDVRELAAKFKLGAAS